MKKNVINTTITMNIKDIYLSESSHSSFSNGTYSMNITITYITLNLNKKGLN